MEPSKPQRVVLLFLAGLVTGAWGLIIWLATIVTQSQLSTLHYIAELANLK